MADWEEVKRLAADFQRVQLTSAKQKLSERNVVELVNRLIQLKLIDVMYTVDGKEYLTHQELVKEMKEELVVHGGRISLVDLHQILNVDFSHIQTKAGEIVGRDRSISLVLGQLIDKNYQERLAEEINDKLQEQGHLSIADLCKAFDLPADFLSEVIQARLGTVIKGQIDKYERDVFFTQKYVARMKSKIRGAFSGVTRPTVVTGVIQQCGCQERLFFSILDGLLKSGRLAGSISGPRHERATYLPDIYTKSQNEWVDSFYRQNGYLEYDSLTRLGISDCKNYIKKRFKDEPLVYLKTCCVGKAVQDLLESSVDEALSTGTWIDVMTVLPSIFSSSDANQLLSTYLKAHPEAIVSNDSIVVSEKLVSECCKPFADLIASKAEKDARSNPVFLKPEGDKSQGTKVAGIDDGNSAREDKKEQRRKKQATSTKSGGGTQGREIKTKSTKKKSKGRDHDADSDEENSGGTSRGRQQELLFMKIDEIEDVLGKQDQLRDCPDELLNEIAVRISRPLNRQYQEMVKSVFLQSAGTATGSDRKKIHGELQERIMGLWTNTKLFEKGLKNLRDNTQSQLAKHLLKTVCTDIGSIVISAVAVENMLTVPEDLSTAEARLKIISKLSSKVQAPVTKLHLSLNGQSLEEFHSQLDILCGPEHLGIMLKKPDKRKERQIVFNHRQSLADQLKQEAEPAMALHLAVVILFQTYTQNMIHAPGRLVPQIVQFLSEHMEKESHKTLVSLQELVVKHAKLQSESSEDKPLQEEMESVVEEMKQLLPEVKEIALTAKKNNPTQDE